MSAIRHETLTNKGKVENLEPLWSHYTELLDKFMREMNYNLVKGNGVIRKTKAKPYQEDIKVLYDRAIKAHNKKVEKGEATKDLSKKLKEINNVVMIKHMRLIHLGVLYFLIKSRGF